MVTFCAATADDHCVWWTWVLGGLVVWLGVAVALALVVGRGIRIADRRSAGTDAPLTTADLPGGFVSPMPARRRSIPLSPIGVALAACAVALEATGYALKLNGASGQVAQLLSMDAPLSLPRMFVALLFAAAAFAAVVGAGTFPGRRTWWLAVALVGAAVSSIKAGGTVHARAMAALADALSWRGAVLVSGLLAAVTVAVLLFLSRTERRDRRRVLGSLAGYAAAAVGLSAITAAAPSSWQVTATFVEESGEALAGVAFLIAVLVGVAPKLALPADWPLRRTDDAQTVDGAVRLPRRTVAPVDRHRSEPGGRP
jgi:hypothetical protein